MTLLNEMQLPRRAEKKHPKILKLNSQNERPNRVRP
jgi:hypothetical protein